MSHNLRDILALNVKQYREVKGYRREELSLLLGVDNSYISKLERKKINITIDKLEQLSKILETDVIKLLSK